MSPTRRLGWYVLLGLCLAGLASAAFGPRYGGRLVVGVLGTLPGPPSTGAHARLTHALLHETLISVAHGGFAGPALASRISADPTGRSFLLSLPDSARFHDGSPLVANDVVRSLRRFLRTRHSQAAAVLADGLAGGRAFRAGQSEALPGLEATDAHSVLLSFEQPRAHALLPLAAPAAAITSASGQGCGPFMPGAAPPGQLAFKAFVGHVHGRPFLDEVAIVGYRSGAALASALASGHVDAALSSPAGAGFEAPDATLLLVLDAGRPPFDRAATRAALAARLETHTGLATLVAGRRTRTLLPSSMDWQGFEPPAPDPNDRPLQGRIRLAVERGVPPLASQHVAALLVDAGLAVDVQPSEAPNARGAAAEARLLLFLPEIAEAGFALEELAALGARDALAEAALLEARRERNPDARRALLLRAEGALRAGHALLPLLALPSGLDLGPGIFDARVDATGTPRLADAWRLP